jgi:membrane fusion protein (multidrug efflux system)
MKWKIFFAVVIVVVIFVILAKVKFLQIGAMIAFGKTFVPPPDSVSSAVAQEEKWQDTLNAVGSVKRGAGRDVAPEVAGTVTEIDFESGAVVNKGDLLVKLDTSTEEAQLQAAEAQCGTRAAQRGTHAEIKRGQNRFAIRTGPGRGDVETKPGQRRRNPRDD